MFVFRSPYPNSLLKKEQERQTYILSWLTRSMLQEAISDLAFFERFSNGKPAASFNTSFAKGHRNFLPFSFTQRDFSYNYYCQSQAIYCRTTAESKTRLSDTWRRCDKMKSWAKLSGLLVTTESLGAITALVWILETQVGSVFQVLSKTQQTFGDNGVLGSHDVPVLEA